MTRSAASRVSASERTTSRRRVLLGTAAIGATLAGCLGRGGGGSGDGEGGGVPADALSTPVKGDPEAGVTVAVFEDFACPHCRTYVLDVASRIDQEYVQPGRIRYEHHDFPIPVDQEISWQAASAARAVQDRVGDEAFFEYATALYEDQDALGPDRYESLAGGFEVDAGFVRTAAVEERYRNVIEADRSAGEDRGVSGTPTVFVNDQSVDPTYEAISTAIQTAR